MGATARKLKQLQIKQFTSEEIKEIQNFIRFMLKGTKLNGYIKIFNNQDYYSGYGYTQKVVTVKELLTFNVLDEILNNSQFEPINLFYSVNTYVENKNLSEDNIQAINNILIDIDYKKSFFKNLSKEEFTQLLEFEHFGQDIPCPSALIHTGNNFHMIYKIKYPVNATDNAKKLAKRIQKEITKKLIDFNADKSVNLTTSTRFLNTYNSKTNELVSVKLYDNKQYELRELQEWLPELPSWYDKWKVEQKKNKNKKQKVVRFHNLYSLLVARIEDLNKLQELRGYSCHGYRELMCFLYRNFSMQMNLIGDSSKSAAKQAESQMLEFNNRFKRPLMDKRIESKTRNIERKQYNFTNRTIIEMLNISEEEQQSLKTVISKQEKANRDKKCKKVYEEVRKESRRNKEGLTKREQEKRDKVMKVKELMETGKTNKEMAKILGVSIRQVQNLKKEI